MTLGIQNEGHTLHDAVAYSSCGRARSGHGPIRTGESESEAGSDPSGQDLGFLGLRGNGRHYMAWDIIEPGFLNRQPGWGLMN